MDKVQRKEQLNNTIKEGIKKGPSYQEFSKIWGSEIPLNSTREFWKGPEKDNLQLSGLGFKALRREIKPYIFVISDTISSRVWMNLKYYFEGPFYIDGRKLYLFDDKDFVIVQLHNGDFAKYIVNQLTDDDGKSTD